MKTNGLIEKYNDGLADESEIKQLEALIASGHVMLTALTDLHALEERVCELEMPLPSPRLDYLFYASLAAEKSKAGSPVFSLSPYLRSLSWARLAMAASLVIGGFLAGRFLVPAPDHPSVAVLTKEVSDLKEIVMLSLLEKESATDRLRAVSLSTDMDKAGKRITTALLQTLNTDENINVRLAALEALKPYSGQSEVREGLVKSIARQHSPLVQISLAELMVALQEKKSVNELKKLLNDRQTPIEVKRKINESIHTLI